MDSGDSFKPIDYQQQITMIYYHTGLAILLKMSNFFDNV